MKREKRPVQEFINKGFRIEPKEVWVILQSPYMLDNAMGSYLRQGLISDVQYAFDRFHGSYICRFQFTPQIDPQTEWAIMLNVEDYDPQETRKERRRRWRRYEFAP